METHLTPQDIKDTIVGVLFDKTYGHLITCTLELKNGAKVLGYNYGSIDPARQDDQMGRDAAYKMAEDKVWELEGYLLRQRRHESEEGADHG